MFSGPRIFQILFLTCILTSAPRAWSAELSVEGELQLGQRFFLKDPAKAPPHSQNSGGFTWFTPTLQYAGEESRFRMKGIVGLDNSEYDPKDRTQVVPQEFFLETRRGSWNLLVGLNTYNWGVTDVVNPLDVVNPRWMRNPITPQKIGSPGLALTQSWDSGSVEAVYIPHQLRPELPTTSSRYLPRDLSFANYVGEFQGQAVQIQMPDEALRFTMADSEDSRVSAFKHNVALRLRQSFWNMEAQVIAFEGLPSFPDFSSPEVTLNTVSFSPPTFELSPDVRLTPKYQRLRIFGAGATVSFDNVLMKLAFADTHRASSDYVVSLPQTAVLGVESSRTLWGLDTTFILQAHAVKDKSRLTESVYSTREIFDGSYLVGVRMASGLDWTLLFGTLQNPATAGQVTTIEATYRYSDPVQLKATTIHLRGREGGLLHAMENASEVALSVLIYF